MQAEVELDLRARWLGKDPHTGELLRDTTLNTLRARCAKGCLERPESFDLRGIDLSGENLRDLDLSRYDLSEANLSGADLSGSNMSFARLHGTLLSKARLDRCEFLGAEMPGAQCNECTGVAVGFGAADLSGASLVSADLATSSFAKAKLTQADLRAANLTGTRMADADLTGALFTRAILRGSDLKHCRLAGTSFRSADLREARLLGVTGYKRADWIGADIREVDLRGAYLVRRHIEDENYLFEFRTRSRMHSVIYWLWWLTSDCGRSLLRWTVLLILVTCLFAILYMLVDVDYGKASGPFASFYFSVVTLTTLGYGDVRPVSTAAQVLTALQALLGYIGLGGLLSILANKMARRAG